MKYGYKRQISLSFEEAVEKIKTELAKEEFGVLTEIDVKETLNAIKSIKHILNLLIAGNADDIAAFCSSDKAFIKSWGMPTHYAVFRKGSE